MYFLYEQNKKDYYFVREEVFVKEQGFQNEFDDIDTYAIHITAYDNGHVLGCARCFMDGKDTYRIGRIAVLQTYRKKGLGAQLVLECERIAKSKGANKVVLDAQCRALSFYEKLGYYANGKEHMDEHVPHMEMKKDL